MGKCCTKDGVRQSVEVDLHHGGST